MSKKRTWESYMGFKENNSKEATAKAAEEQVKRIKGKNYPALVKQLRDTNMWLQSSYFYEHYWFDILMFFFLGMAFFKSGYLLGNKPTWLYAVIAIAGIGVGSANELFFPANTIPFKIRQLSFYTTMEI